MKKILLLSFIVIHTVVLSQFSSGTTVKIAPISGTVIAGYVDHGAFLNFTGPNISFNKSGHFVYLGMLPSLRFNKDSGATKNSLITPGLGFGLTYTYNAFAIQIPFYYNSKTNLKDGNWQIGIGVGCKISNIKPIKKKKS